MQDQQERTKAAKEREWAKMRAHQVPAECFYINVKEKIMDTRAEEDALRAKRATEAKERFVIN